MNCKKGMATFLALAVAANATGAPVHAEGKSFLERMETLERANWTMAPWRNVLNTLGDLQEDIDKLDNVFLQDQYFDGNLTLAEKIFNAPKRHVAKNEGYNETLLAQEFTGYESDVCMSDEAVHEYQQQVAELLEGSWLDLVNGTDLMLHMKDGRVFNCVDLLPEGLCKDLIRTFTEEGREAAEKQLRDGIAALLVSGLVLVVASIIAKLKFGAGTTTTTGGGPDGGAGPGNGGGDNPYKGLTFEEKKVKLQELLKVVETFKKNLTNLGYTGLAKVVQTALNRIISNGTVLEFMARQGAVTEENIDNLLQQATALQGQQHGWQSTFADAQRALQTYVTNYTTANASVANFLNGLPRGNLHTYVETFWQGEAGPTAPDAFNDFVNLQRDLAASAERLTGINNTIPHLQQARQVAIDINNAVTTAGDAVPQELQDIQRGFNAIEWNVPGAVAANALQVKKLALRLRVYQLQAKINNLPKGDNKDAFQQKLKNLVQQVTDLANIAGATEIEQGLQNLEGEVSSAAQKKEEIKEEESKQKEEEEQKRKEEAERLKKEQEEKEKRERLKKEQEEKEKREREEAERKQKEEEERIEKEEEIKKKPAGKKEEIKEIKEIKEQQVEEKKDEVVAPNVAEEQQQQQVEPAVEVEQPKKQENPEEDHQPMDDQHAPQVVNVEQQIEMPLDADGRVEAAKAAFQAAKEAFDDGDGDENERIAVIARHLDTVHQLIDQHKNELQLSGSSDDEVMDQLSRIRNKIERFLKALREAAEEEDFTEDDDNDQEDDDKGGKDGDNGGNGLKEDEKKEEKDDVNGSDNDQQQNPAPNADQSNLNNNENNEEHSRVDLAYWANVAKHIPECLFTKENLGAAAGVGVAAATSGIPAAIPAAGVAAIGYNTLKCADEKATMELYRK